MKRNILIGGSILVLLFACKKSAAPATTADRAFYMGMTPWPADFTLEGLDDAYGFINNHCDIVSHHFDEGIPYEEAYRGWPMPAKLQGNVQYRQQRTATGKTILLSVAALDISRHHLAGYTTDTDTHNDSIEHYWAQLPANDPRVVTAYVNFISYLVDALHPVFVNYGVESNAAPGWDPAEFLRYKDFLSQVYPRLKAKYPTLPFFLSFIVSELPEATDKARRLFHPFHRPGAGQALGLCRDGLYCPGPGHPGLPVEQTGYRGLAAGLS